MAAISLVVPVYNVAAYLRPCLDSLTGQTCRDIEIILVDDCSSDGSSAILAEYAEKDSRITLLHHDTNLTAAQSRKDGALASHGAWVLFVDPDDLLAPDACERLLALAQQHPADVIHFSADVLADESVPAARAAYVTGMLRPHRGELTGNRLNDACFVQKQFGFQIWNKLLRGDVCRRAMAEFPDGRYPKAQDLMALYIILFYARSYYGAETPPWYHYRLGVGVTGAEYLTHGQIDALAHQLRVVDGLRAFLESHGALDACHESLEAIDAQLTADVLARLKQHIAAPDVAYAWASLCRVLGAPRVIGMLAESGLDQEGDWAERLSSIPNPYQPRPVKVIGAFYLRLSNGGAQRVAAELTRVWAKLGYQVVMFTDAAPTDEDYPTDAIRVVLPDCRNEYATTNRARRAQVLHEAVQKYHIDLFIYHGWLYPMLLWDLLAVKSAGAAFYIHTHSVFSMPLRSSEFAHRFFACQHIYPMADGVICLSRADAAYWRLFNRRVFQVVNPIFFDLEKTAVSPLEGQEIIWVGRISAEKKPLQVIEIFARVLRQVPGAHLSIIGSGPATLEGDMRDKAKALRVQDHVTFHGYQSDVLPFYQRADVYLSTSAYEGAPLSPLEAQGCGVPVVAYALPYLTILEGSEGSVSVPQDDQRAAAEAIIALLTDDDYRHAMGRAARRNVETRMAVDMAALWQPILLSAESAVALPEADGAVALPKAGGAVALPEAGANPTSVAPSIPDPDTQLMIRTLSEHLRAMRPPTATAAPTEFFPLPTSGPCRMLRKKAATFLSKLLIEGITPSIRAFKAAYQARRESKPRT